MEEVPDNFIDQVISMNQYFKKIKCEPFFIHHRKTNMIEACLDNPNEKFLLQVTINILFSLKKIM